MDRRFNHPQGREWCLLKACVFKAEVRVRLPFVFPHPHPSMPLQAAFAHFWSPATITRDNWSDLAGFHLCQCEMSTLSFPPKRSWTKSVSYWFLTPKWMGMHLQLAVFSECLLLHKGGNTRNFRIKKRILLQGLFSLHEKVCVSHQCGRLCDVLAGADPGFGQGGAPASEAESCRRSEAESREQSKHSAARVQGP